MIAKVLRGQRATGLLQYLFGPGERNEHVNPRVVAAWDGRDYEPDSRRLGGLLDSTWRAAQMTPDDRPVYHVSVAVARADSDRGLPADPDLTDAQFREVCEALMRRVGIADACRWVAIRHDQPGESHAHIVATLATESGRRFHPPKGDFYRLGDVCREFEAKFGLRVTAPRERAVPKRATSQETRKADRKQWRQPTRVVLQEKVRAVAGTAEGVDDFLRRLRDEGLLVKERHSPRDGSITGYAVAEQRPAKDGTVEQIWFSGGKLAADLTIPKLRQRWPDAAETPRPELLVDRDDVWSWAANAVRDATGRVRSFASDPSSARQAAWEASDFLASLSRLVPGREGRVIRDSAWGFERAGYAALGPGEKPLRTGGGLREAARLLTVARFVPRDDMRALLSLMAQLAVLAEAIERMRAEQDRAHQAEAARRAAQALRNISPKIVPDETEYRMPLRTASREAEVSL